MGEAGDWLCVTKPLLLARVPEAGVLESRSSIQAPLHPGPSQRCCLRRVQTEVVPASAGPFPPPAVLQLSPTSACVQTRRRQVPSDRTLLPSFTESYLCSWLLSLARLR